MTDQTPGCGATSDARKRRTEAHQIHPDPAVCVIVAREVAAAERRAHTEALHCAAVEFTEVYAEVWGGDEMWLTSGTRVGRLVAGILREMAGDWS